jgi:SAM-dependent methyltransferase
VNFKEHYASGELQLIAARVGIREGWDFSRMNTTHPAKSWEYLLVARDYLRPTDSLIDIGTGGGERLLELRADARFLLGVDPDVQMIERARELALRECARNVQFQVGTGVEIDDKFDVAINRHAPFEAHLVGRLLRAGGYFVTQQVGERNMMNVKEAFQLDAKQSGPIDLDVVEENGFKVERFDEYDIAYVIGDIDSLLFWLQALDVAHSDFIGFDAERDTEAINRLLSTSLTPEGLVTNEHRYLLVAVKNE